MSPIRQEDVCAEAVAALGYPFRVLSGRLGLKNPEGCYLAPNDEDLVFAYCNIDPLQRGGGAEL
eukprot:796708-Amphidinium_carterae.1